MGNLSGVPDRPRRDGPWCDDCVCYRLRWDATSGRVQRTVIPERPRDPDQATFYDAMRRDTIASPPLSSDAAAAPLAWGDGMRFDIGDRACLYVDASSDEVYLWERPVSAQSPSSSSVPDVVHPDIVRFLYAFIRREDECRTCLQRRPLVRLPLCRHRVVCEECVQRMIEMATGPHILCPICRGKQLIATLIPVNRHLDCCDRREYAPRAERRIRVKLRPRPQPDADDRPLPPYLRYHRLVLPNRLSRQIN